MEKAEAAGLSASRTTRLSLEMEQASRGEGWGSWGTDNRLGQTWGHCRLKGAIVPVGDHEELWSVRGSEPIPKTALMTTASLYVMTGSR